MKKASKLPQLLEFDLHALIHGSIPLDRAMVQLSLFNKSYDRIIGVDEVGRGCLAGPVMASAVSFDLKTLTEEKLDALSKLDDSKKISQKRRESLSEAIRSYSVFAIGHVSNEDIDKYNILNASMIAMEKAVERLLEKPELKEVDQSRILVLVDGRKGMSALRVNQLPVTKGDDRSFSIASASIVAKVTRDKLMQRYNRKYPQFSWNQNKGYPSKVHVEAIKRFGPSPFHRLSFSW